MEREWRPNNVEMIPHCPRCGSSNTKFCYYNNYSLTQPRYFCKGCRRYWTRGGSLRNVPVGGGCRKNRRSRSSLRTTSTDHRGLPKNINQTTYRGLDPNCSMSHSSYGPNRNPSIDPVVVGSSVAPHDGPNIDLAVVYANFVNQPQEQQKPQVLELPSDHRIEVGLPFDFSGVPELNLDQEIQLSSHGNCLLMCDGSQSGISSQQLYLSDLDMQQERIERFTSHDTSNAFELPPLPGEDTISSQEIIPLPCLDSQIVSDQMQMQMQGLQPENQDLNQLVGNWSPFY